MAETRNPQLNIGRVPSEDRRLIEIAAELEGKALTEFCRDAVMNRAQEVIAKADKQTNEAREIVLKGGWESKEE